VGKAVRNAERVSDINSCIDHVTRAA